MPRQVSDDGSWLLVPTSPALSLPWVRTDRDGGDMQVISPGSSARSS